MGFWHTGYMEFHEPVGLGSVVAEPVAPEFRCDQCDQSFPTFDALRVHRFESHPSMRPVLYLRGREVGSAVVRVTRPLQPDQVQVLHSVEAALNGQPVAQTELGSTIAALDSGTAFLALKGDGASAEFKLRFEIARPDDLAGVEACFETAAHRGRLDRRAIEDFIEAARRFPSAIAYCDGICEYLYGVLAKERSPDSSLPFDEYREKFNRAADALHDIDRPLAGIIESLITFHFNHFETAIARGRGTRVEHASTRFRSWILGSTSGTNMAIKSNQASLDGMVTDVDTERLLRWVLMKPDQLRLATPEIEAAVACDISEFDRVKLRLILAHAYIIDGRTRDAASHARELWNNPIFGTWAEAFLKRHA